MTNALDSFLGQFTDLNRYMIGFDQVHRQLRSLIDGTLPSASLSSWPPYNVKKVDDNRYVIEMAVAGFGKGDIEITLKDGDLKIAGKMNAATPADEKTLYQGIASRQFSRVFSLADTVEVKNAELVNGMLRVWLDSAAKLSETKKIPIDDAGKEASKPELLTEGKPGTEGDVGC